MTRITESADCGNSPKNLLMQTIAIGLETGEISAALLADDVIWHRASGQVVKGASAVARTLDQATPPKTLVVDHAITHGKVGAASGRCSDASSGSRGFAHVITFTTASAKTIATINSYTAD